MKMREVGSSQLAVVSRQLAVVSWQDSFILIDHDQDQVGIGCRNIFIKLGYRWAHENVSFEEV